MHPFTKQLLDARGLDESFLFPSYENDTHSPFLFGDMEKAINRLHEAIQKKESILVYADYDCDGIPGAVILYDLLRACGVTPDVYIPDRHDEGYGLHEVALRAAKKRGISLCITVDVGITANETINTLQKEGLDIILTDHHIPGSSIPSAYACVHPSVGLYPNPHICGAGVAFKLVQAFIKRYGTYYAIPIGFDKWLLDLVAIATVADMVSLTGENRALVHYGLIVLKKTRRIGLQVLFRSARSNILYADEEDIGFIVAPRINAASRMDSPMIAFLLLSSTNETEAVQYAKTLEKLNTLRKTETARIVKEAHARLSDIDSIIVLGNPSWRVGVLGLVASRLCDVYDRPTFVWGGEERKGSCRSNDTLSVVSIMQHAPEDTFITYGGHEAAGGFCVHPDAIHSLPERLGKAAEKVPVTLQKEVKTDIIISINEVNKELFRAIAPLKPFGIGNSAPRFRFNDVVIATVRTFGKDKEHLELLIQTPHGVIPAIAFYAPKHFSSCPSSCSIVGTIEIDKFSKSLRIHIIDLLY